MEKNSDRRYGGRDKASGKGSYQGDMLFDDDENYDDDMDEYEEDAYYDSAFAPEGSDAGYDGYDDEYEDGYDDGYDDEGYYDDEAAGEADVRGGSRNMDTAGLKRKKKNKIWLIVLAVEVVAAIIIGVLLFNSFINRTLGQMTYTELDDTHVNDDIAEESVKKMTGYANIALFGIDTREAGMEDDGVRSDSIIICSINNDTKEIKLVSVYRDTYLELCNDYESYEKATHAYAYDGAQGAVNMLNKNLDLNITDYVSVNFTALTEAIDALGGLDIELKEEELERLNMCIDEQIGINGIYSDHVYETGVVHLNGVQATAYARIRSTDDGDITRAWRQRTIISKMIDAAKTAGITKLLDCIDVVVDDVASSLTSDEIMDMAKSCFDYELSTTTGFPFTLTTAMMDEVSYVVPCDLQTNVTALHRFLFDDRNYTPSMTVQTISENVVYASGCYNTLDLDTFVVEDDVDSIVTTEAATDSYDDDSYSDDSYGY